eukprot:RCo040260
MTVLTSPGPGCFLEPRKPSSVRLSFFSVLPLLTAGLLGLPVVGLCLPFVAVGVPLLLVGSVVVAGMLALGAVGIPSSVIGVPVVGLAVGAVSATVAVLLGGLMIVLGPGLLLFGSPAVVYYLYVSHRIAGALLVGASVLASSAVVLTLLAGFPVARRAIPAVASLCFSVRARQMSWKAQLFGPTPP